MGRNWNKFAIKLGIIQYLINAKWKFPGRNNKTIKSDKIHVNFKLIFYHVFVVLTKKTC